MKEFHIISSGVSILTNAQRAGVLPVEVRISDESYWKSILDEPTKIKEIKDFVSRDPYKHSAELNTFLRVIDGKNSKDIEVYLFGTNTSSSELCRIVLEQILKEKGVKLYTPIEISGYFWEAQYDSNYAIDEFKKGVSELLDRLIALGRKKKEEGYKVFFNPTGGLKAHVIVTALAAFLIDADVYYMNEEFNDIVFMPHLFYLPKGGELKILEKLHSESIVSGLEAQNLYNEMKNELERLSLYGLITLETNEEGIIYRIRITNKGKLLYMKSKT